MLNFPQDLTFRFFEDKITIDFATKTRTILW